MCWSAHLVYSSIIHGWTYTPEPWKRTIKLLSEQGIDVEMLHVPGLTAPSQKIWTIEEYTKWADQHIPDGAIALGHSNGGRILLNLCANHPTKLRKLILLDAAGVYEPSKKRDFLRKISKIATPIKRVSILRKIFHKIIGASDYSHAPENMKHTLANMLDSDKSLQLEKVTTVAAILWGEKDTVTPPRQARTLHAKLPHSTLKFFKDWTHAPYISDPDGLARAIIAELAQGADK